MKKLIASSVVFASGMAFLVGCGDENNTTEITQVIGMQVLDKGEALPKCSADNEGAMVYSMDSAEAYYCVNKKWKSLDGNGGDGKNGADGEPGLAGADGKDGKDGAAGADGKDGSSCTAKALENGNGYKIVCGGDSVGVVLNGEKGDTGAKGDSGVAGANGLSAYEIAKAAGFNGSEEEWIVSLKGEPGAKGDSGVAGLSAYEIAKAAGFKGSEEEWIVSLKGDPGAKGDTGVAGLSAYEIAKAGGYAGSVEQWVASLKGDPGDPGINCEIVTDSGSVLEMKCGTQTSTIYKAVCGKDHYDPSKKFCYGVDLYDYCDGKTYNPDKQFCAKFSDESEQIYKMVTIKVVNYTKTWMAENLNYKTQKSWCVVNNESYCSKYGRLYTWASAVGKSEDECGYGVKCNLGNGKIRGVCPKGWHLPDTTEWNALFDAVGGKATAGTMLKSTEGWDDRHDGTSGNGSDIFDFSALPAGYRNTQGHYGSVGGDAFFWSSTQNGKTNAYYMDLYNNYDYGSLNNLDKDVAYSIRCVKD